MGVGDFRVAVDDYARRISLTVIKESYTCVTCTRSNKYRYGSCVYSIVSYTYLVFRLTRAAEIISLITHYSKKPLSQQEVE